MSGERIFRDAELESMGSCTLHVLLEAIKSGNQEKATTLASRMYAEFSAMHDLYRDWLTHTLSWIGIHFGEEALSKALEEGVKGFTDRYRNRYEGKPLKRRIEILMAGLRGHLQPLKIEEDEEKFTISLDPCGSGGRQISSGMYEGPGAFLKIKGPYPWTFNRTDFPVYCAHCFYQNKFPLLPGNDISFEVVPGDPPGHTTCKFYIYKR
jgi:hypothetical protein